MENRKKIGLVMEGGAMRGMFTAGVTDVLMENGIEFDGAIGTSAGVTFGCNVKSKQIGRAIRYNKRFVGDKRYASVHSLLTTGDLFNVDFCYRVLPTELDPFDTETFAANPMPFWATATDVETGKAVYFRLDHGDEADVEKMRASASMPMLSNIVEIEGKKLLDGGVADSIPVRQMERLGFSRNVVILTQPLGFRKEKNSYLPVARVRLKEYPKLIEALADRHIRYNKTTAYIRREEEMGNMFVIRPPEPLNIHSTVKDPEELERVYQIGRSVMEQQLPKLRTWMYLCRQ